jgi:cytoskeletal protein CcmA (bactofilin family)
LTNAIKGLIRWARTTKSGPDDLDFPYQQVSYQGKVGDAIMWFPYGYHANLPPDYLNAIIALGGNPEARVALPGSPQQRIYPIAESEVVVYHPVKKSKIHFRANGDIEITTDNLQHIHLLRDKIWIDTPLDLDADVGGNATVDVVGDIDVTSSTGDITAKTDVGKIKVDAKTEVDVDAATTVNIQGVGAVTLKSTTAKLTIEATAGAMDVKALGGALTLESSGDLTLVSTGGQVRVGTADPGSDEPIARVGDRVGGSPLQIIEGSSKAQAAD